MPDSSSAPGSPPSDLDRLRAAHSGWVITAIWVSAASGPDVRQIAARRGGVTVAAWDETELSARIGEAERLHGWQ
jgi:hypothetical protein